MDSRTVFVLGGTGYIGQAIIQELIRQNFTPILLVRPQSQSKLPENVVKASQIILGDASRLRSYQPDIKKLQPDYFIYAIGLLRENAEQGHTYPDFHVTWLRQAVELAERISIRRFALISANGITDQSTTYAQTKLAGEKILEESTLSHTILRPSTVVGYARTYHFMDEIINLLKYPIVPLIGKGQWQMAPVYRHDLAKVVVQSLTDRESKGKTYHLCGPHITTLKDLLRVTATQLNKRRIFLPIPKFLVMTAAKLLGSKTWFPLTPDLVNMLTAGNTCPDQSVWKHFGIKPKSVYDALKEYAE